MLAPTPVTINHGNDFFINRELISNESNLHIPSYLSRLDHILDQSHNPCVSLGGGDPTISKRQQHNASERERRKKINTLYSSIRSLLPVKDQTKKLSIPNTIARVVKYIPELQKDVEKMVKRKEALLSSITKQVDRKPTKDYTIPRRYFSSNVSMERLSEREISLQISTISQPHIFSLSKVLVILEKEYGQKEYGLCLINESSFEGFGGWVSHNLLLLEGEGTQRVDVEALRKHLLSLYV